MGHGAQKIFNKFNNGKRVVATIGDSTFFHTGINSLLQVVYNNSNTVTCILDNRITGMTGHQENPGTGFTLQKALGVEHVRTVNPLKIKEVKDALDWALALDEPSVIITRWPCVLKKQSIDDKKEFGNYFGKCQVATEKCIGCKKCTTTGCPSLRFHKDTNKVIIDEVQCVGCEVCSQVCPVQAIEKVGE